MIENTTERVMSGKVIMEKLQAIRRIRLSRRIRLYHCVFCLFLAGSIMSQMAVAHEMKAAVHLSGGILVIISGLFLVIMRAWRSGFPVSFDEKLVIIYAAVTIVSKIAQLTPDIHDYGLPLLFAFYYISVSSYVKFASSRCDLVTRLCVTFGVVSYILAGAGVVLGREQFELMLSGAGKWGYPGDRAFLLMGLSHNPNWLAFDLMIGVLSFTALSFRSISEKRFPRSVFFAVCAFPLCAYIGVLGTRTVIAVIALYLFFTFVAHMRKILPVSRAAWIICAAGIAAAIAAVLYSGVYQTVIPKMDRGLSTRDILWAKVMAKQAAAFPGMHTFFGWGTKLLNEYIAPHREHLHNLALHIWTLNGVFSLLSLLTFLFYAVIRSLSNARYWYISFIPLVILIREIFEATIGVKIFHWGVAAMFAFMAMTAYEKTRNPDLD